MQACLDREGETAASMGYDRPSPKLMGFLRKHYGEPPWSGFDVFSLQSPRWLLSR